MPSPVATAVFPDCGGDCNEIARCYVSCAERTGYQINSCFCSILSWPTACGVQCSHTDDRSSLAAWYWNVCPSKMDSQLGQIGITRMQNPIITVDDWAVPTPPTTMTLTGYDCYYSSQCSEATPPPTGVSTIQPLPDPSNTGADKVVNAVKSLLVKILVPIFLAAFGIAMFILYRRQRQRYHRDRHLSSGNGRRQVVEHGFARNQIRNRQDDDQMVNLLQVIVDLLDQPPPAQPDNATINAIQRANNSIAEIRVTVANILARLGQRPDGQNLAENPAPRDELQEALRQQLSCPICFEIFHHPVAVINDAAYQGGGCCKSWFPAPTIFAHWDLVHTFCGINYPFFLLFE